MREDTAMSLLRNFTPGGGEPDDDEQPTTGEQPTTAARPDEAGPPDGGPGASSARYAFAAPAADTGASADPAPDTVVRSEVVTEPDVAPALVDEAPEAPVPSFTPAPETASHATFSPEVPVPETAPIPAVQTTAVPVPSPRGTDEDEDDLAWPSAARPEPDFTAPLLADAAELRTRWQRVQGDFVDDPQAAVSNADDLVEQAAEALVGALRQRQRQLRTAWERNPAGGQSPATAPLTPDTEHLRLMMQRYRALFNELCRPS
jgi:hypothetical protein